MDKIYLIYLKASNQNQFGGAHYVCAVSQQHEGFHNTQNMV